MSDGDKRNGGGRRSPLDKGNIPGAGRYDLGVPGLVAQCIEDMYRSTGAPAVPFSRLPVIALVTGIALGLVFGYGPGGRLYGPIGAALGFVFGLVGGGAAAVFIHWGLRPFFRPEAHAMFLARMGRMRSASAAIRRAGWWVFRGEGASNRFAALFFGMLGIGRNDLPPDIALANMEACGGIFAESVGDSQAAAEAYLAALECWPRHGFALISLLDLVWREEMWELEEKATEIAQRYIETTRDKTLKGAAGKYLELIKPGPEGPPKPPLRIAEEGAEYRKSPQAAKYQWCRLIENPGSQISNGMLVVSDHLKEKTVKLAPMPFQLLVVLAETMRSCRQDMDPAQRGWVSINDLLTSLPWTTPNVTNSNVHKLVYKTRNQLAASGLERSLVEENLNGCYRLSLEPEKIEVERVAAA